jgi:hypothetical protein
VGRFLPGPPLNQRTTGSVAGFDSDSTSLEGIKGANIRDIDLPIVKMSSGRSHIQITRILLTWKSTSPAWETTEIEVTQRRKKSQKNELTNLVISSGA